MDASSWSLIGIAVVTIIVGLIGWLLSRKDAQQEKFIDDLYVKFRGVSKDLSDFQLEIAKNFHPKAEIQELFKQQKMHMDDRFDRIEKAINERRIKDADL